MTLQLSREGVFSCMVKNAHGGSADVRICLLECWVLSCELGRTRSSWVEIVAKFHVGAYMRVLGLHISAILNYCCSTT
jgi:hypothetical protein